MNPLGAAILVGDKVWITEQDRVRRTLSKELYI